MLTSRLINKTLVELSLIRNQPISNIILLEQSFAVNDAIYVIGATDYLIISSCEILY